MMNDNIKWYRENVDAFPERQLMIDPVEREKPHVDGSSKRKKCC